MLMRTGHSAFNTFVNDLFCYAFFELRSCIEYLLTDSRNETRQVLTGQKFKIYW